MSMGKTEEVLLKLESEQVEKHNRADSTDEVFQKIAYIHAEIDDNLKRLIHGQTFYRRAAEAKR